MNDVTIASSEADARAAEAVEQHHAQMAGALAVKAEALSAAARAGRPADADEVRRDLVGWCRTELVPHALAEESTMYRAAGAMPEGRLLVEAMLVEHQRILGLVDALEAATDPVTSAALARALRELFEAHLAKENDQVLPLLVSTPAVSVAELLGGMHELLGGHGVSTGSTHEAGSTDGAGSTDEAGSADHQGGCGSAGHACGCHEAEAPGYPELDARTIPHAIRHATIFGALDAVRAGNGLVLVAPHDPLPLLAQLEQREPGAFDVEYVERGPEAWRLQLVRHAG